MLSCNIYLFHKIFFFPNKEKRNALNTLIRSSKLGWINAEDGMSMPVSDHFAKWRKSNMFPDFSYESAHLKY